MSFGMVRGDIFNKKEGNYSGLGSEATLDLINGHLTETSYHGGSSSLFDLFTPFLSNDTLKNLNNWYCYEDYGVDLSTLAAIKRSHYVFKVQHFESGGYEVVLRPVDLKELVAVLDTVSHGERSPHDQKEEDIESSIARSKKKIRLKIKSMGCDRLLTLTRRESDENYYWIKEDWKIAWDSFRRLCIKHGYLSDYVAVLEKHKKGNYHMHVAIVDNLPVKLIRRLWLMCCGKGEKGSGNIDIQFKGNLSDSKRRSGIAKYVSKYISKQLGDSEFNKKRYWSSKHKLPKPERYVLKASNFNDALKEVCGLLHLDIQLLNESSESFVFSDGEGIWFNFDESMVVKNE